MERFERDFYLCDAVTLAQRLLGTLLVHRTPDGEASGLIVETEAYMGHIDAAAHSYKRREGGRTSIMYDEGGHAYIYLIYGIHNCINVVANGEGTPEAVLIRALEPVGGLDLMRRRRGAATARIDKVESLCSGPGKLCSALGITRAQYGLDLCQSELFIARGPGAPFEITAATRVGIDYAGEAKSYLWRFLISGSRFVSKKPS